MRLFTIIFEYGGGTYIRQVKAAAPEVAMQKGVSAVSTSLEVSKEALENAFTDKDLAPVEDCKSVWSTTALLKDALLLVHMVETRNDT